MKIETAVGPLTIRPTTTADLAAYMRLKDEAAAWLEEKGIRQWPSPHPPHFWAQARLMLADGQSYLAETTGGEAVGTIRLVWVGSRYWATASGRAAYVRNLIIDNGLHGQKVGQALLGWAQAQAVKKGCIYFRLDCLAENRRLCQYYEDLGFQYRGQFQDNDYLAALYELTL